MLVCLSGLIIPLLMSEIVVIENKRNVYMNTTSTLLYQIQHQLLIGKFLLQNQTR